MLYRYRNNFQKKNEKNDALIFPAHNFHSLEISFSKGEKLSYRNRTKDTVGRESALKLVTSPSFLFLFLLFFIVHHEEWIIETVTWKMHT